MHGGQALQKSDVGAGRGDRKKVNHIEKPEEGKTFPGFFVVLVTLFCLNGAAFGCRFRSRI
jgi:hypothetical protein